jgi:hypothetical protein
MNNFEERPSVPPSFTNGLAAIMNAERSSNNDVAETAISLLYLEDPIDEPPKFATIGQTSKSELRRVFGIFDSYRGEIAASNYDVANYEELRNRLEEFINLTLGSSARAKVANDVLKKVAAREFPSSSSLKEPASYYRPSYGADYLRVWPAIYVGDVRGRFLTTRKDVRDHPDLSPDTDTLPRKPLEPVDRSHEKRRPA